MPLRFLIHGRSITISCWRKYPNFPFALSTSQLTTSLSTSPAESYRISTCMVSEFVDLPEGLACNEDANRTCLSILGIASFRARCDRLELSRRRRRSPNSPVHDLPVIGRTPCNWISATQLRLTILSYSLRPGRGITPGGIGSGKLIGVSTGSIGKILRSS